MELKEESYYGDMHDVETIKECLRAKECFLKNMPAQYSEDATENIMNLLLYWVKGDCYRRKVAFVKGCVERDRERHALFQRAQEPAGIRCPNCFSGMKVIVKDLYDLGETPRVLFFFECLKCKKRRGVFDNGEEYKSKPSPCPKCGKPVKSTFSREGSNDIWRTNCSTCSYAEEDVEDCEAERAGRLQREKEDADFLGKYRAEFCLSSEEGENYLQEIVSLKVFSDLLKESEVKQADPDYKKVASLKKWTVVELEKSLSVELAKTRYEKLLLNKPEIDRHVIIPFTVQDTLPERKGRESELLLRRVIKKALVESNWRLMSEGVSYRLGYLSGRLKGYDREEDLVQLVKQESRRS